MGGEAAGAIVEALTLNVRGAGGGQPAPAETNTISKFFPLRLSEYALMSIGVNRWQGGHQLAEKYTPTYLPCSASRADTCPSFDCSWPVWNTSKLSAALR